MIVQDPCEIVPRETVGALEEFVSLLSRWNRRINLISRNDSHDLWQRHIVDSAQLMPLAPKTAESWLDVGSGAGFPGLICAIIAKNERRPITFTLIESDTRKVAFLREAIIRFELPVTILNERIENIALEPQDVISARALASLDKLLDYTYPFSHEKSVFLFPKGRLAKTELTDASKSWHMKVAEIASQTDPEGSILKISEVNRRA